MKRDKRGITLIELIIAVALMGIIAAIAIPSYVGYIRSSKKAEAKTNLQTLRLLLEQYLAENGRYCPATTGCSGRSYEYKEDDNGNVIVETIKTNYLIGFKPKSAAAAGNAVLYDYTITFTSNTAYTITATPVTARGAPPGNLTIDQDGNKTGW